MPELKAKAVEMFGRNFDWFDKGNFSVGIDWDAPFMVVIDLDHPDGAVIQSAGYFDLSTVYSKELI